MRAPGISGSGRSGLVASLAVSLAVSLALGGCLSNTHRVPRDELLRLAQQAPETRGQRLRVIQGFEGDDEPPAAPRAGVHVGVWVPIDVGSPGPGYGGGGAVGGSGGSAGKSGGIAKAGKGEGKSWLVAAAVVAVMLAFTEGARYDGWVRVDPNQPLHVYGPGGQYVRMALGQLDAPTAQWARKAFVREGEGPSWQSLERAPLNRVGWTYSVLLGAARIPSRNGDDDRGFLGHIQLGTFSTKSLGFMLDIGLGWRENEIGETVYDTRYALELQLLPFSAGGLHAGGFGQVGLGVQREDGPGDQYERGYLYGGGALLQLELTTRLALTARAGVLFLDGEALNEFTAGLSIY